LPTPDSGGSLSEVGILQREARKKRCLLPIRRLLKRLPKLLGRLKPCLLMSPLSIAQYLPAGGDPFDLVIFDEASQIAVHDAIGAIARGRQVIVVGDSRQLPPTSFFATDLDGPEDSRNSSEADQLLARDLKSILDETAAALVPSLLLEWHYRSRDERLIAFSNSHYYDNRLQTFPAATLQTQDGVRLVRVDGVFERGTNRVNRAEAKAVVDWLVGHLLEGKTRGSSVGVVTFNQPQQTLIDDLLDEARVAFPEIEPFFGERVPEPVFVKNLENVQGYERDIMLFSITFGPDSSGNISMNFGPLNREGGERRLNVAITRARRRLLVFSGLAPEAIDLGRTRAVGVRDRRDFLRYAAGGDSGAISTQPATLVAKDCPLVNDLADALTGIGWKVDRHLGFSHYRLDLAVRDLESDRYVTSQKRGARAPLRLAK